MSENGFAYIKKADIPKGIETLSYHKVYISKAYGAGDSFPHQIIGKPFYGEPNSVCSQTYLIIGYNQKMHKFSESECKNIIVYIRTKLFRYLVYVKKKTQDNPSSVFQFVPLQDFTEKSDIDWSKSVKEIDGQLYKKYGLTEEEVKFVEGMVKEME